MREPIVDWFIEDLIALYEEILNLNPTATAS